MSRHIPICTGVTIILCIRQYALFVWHPQDNPRYSRIVCIRFNRSLYCTARTIPVCPGCQGQGMYIFLWHPKDHHNVPDIPGYWDVLRVPHKDAYCLIQSIIKESKVHSILLQASQIQHKEYPQDHPAWSISVSYIVYITGFMILSGLCLYVPMLSIRDLMLHVSLKTIYKSTSYLIILCIKGLS